MSPDGKEVLKATFTYANGLPTGVASIASYSFADSSLFLTCSDISIDVRT